MSSIATFSLKDKSTTNVSGKLVITEFGHRRILQRIAEGESFETFNWTCIKIGDKLNTKYDSNISTLLSPTQTFEINKDNISQTEDTFTISAELEFEGGTVMHEIGLYEIYDGVPQLFAYASGFTLIKSKSISYSLTIRLALNIVFNNEHPDNYSVKLNNTNYTLESTVNDLKTGITRFQLDFERCIEMDARNIGYRKEQLAYERHKSFINSIKNVLQFGRYEKTINKMGMKDITDYFFYPTTEQKAYKVQNLRQADSYMAVDNVLQSTNVDYVSLETPMSFVYTAKLNSLTKNGLIIGKIDPSNDRYYFDFRLVQYGSQRAFQFTIYSYDLENEFYAQNSSFDSATKEITWGYNERLLVGHYRVTYPIPPSDVQELSDNEKMYAFTIDYKGEPGSYILDEPKIQFYIGFKNVTDSLIIDNFNYMGPSALYKKTSTLRNYTQNSNMFDFENPTYYYLPEIEVSSIIAFSKVIDESDLKYLSLIEQS